VASLRGSHVRAWDLREPAFQDTRLEAVLTQDEGSGGATATGLAIADVRA